ncbi:MAG: hypothetical protein L6Q31_11900 [Fimbriimonadaceae bacterium]|nr:hypothetical protein [Fimbriimonadaceae bacterium]NUM39695.1 transcriptional regulator [Armatimonadota bacterium]
MSKSFENSNETESIGAAQSLFILEWGRMSSSWGINRTMAQIHALLFVTGRALGVDEIMSALQISRGNASMNLRELMDWGIVRRFRKPGDRKDTYVSDSDAWRMFLRVARAKKRRELDPTAEAIRECLGKLPAHAQSEGAQILKERLNDLLDVFRTLDLIYEHALATDEAFEQTLRLFRPTPDGPATDAP